MPRSSLLLLLLWVVSCFPNAGSAGTQVSLGLDHTVDGSDTNSPWSPREILVTLFQQTGGLSAWHTAQGWSSNTGNVCDWYGITCYPENDATIPSDRWGHVQSLVLTANGLQGTTPPHLWQLPYLQQVALDSNAGLTVDTSQVSNAQHLQRLAVNVDALSDWTTLTTLAPSLQDLTLTPPTTDPGITGMAVPSQLFDLTQLTSLQADDCRLTGSLSSSSRPAGVGVAQWEHLQYLNLNRNMLQGALPAELGLLVNLQALHLGHNHFSGPLPHDELNQLTKLQVLDLSRTADEQAAARPQLGLVGPVPSLHLSSNLRRVDLQHQDLDHSLPADFLLSVPSDQAITVDLRGNQLTGTSLPPLLLTKTQLDLYLADNRYSSLPAQLCHDAPPTWLNGQVQQFEDCRGLLCPVGTFASNPEGRQVSATQPCQPCPSAQFVGQTTCATTATGQVHEGTILQALVQATQGIHWKQSHGWLGTRGDGGTTIPSAQEYCTWHGITCESHHVVELRLPNNDLVGTLPPSVFSLPKLRVLDVSGNAVRLTGQGVEQATQLIVLDLTHTEFAATNNAAAVSTLLTGLQQATNLQVLRLGSNQLQASTLPPQVYQLSSLHELDVSHNDYGGSLSATSIGNWGQLRTLYLQGNQLTGPIPTQVGHLRQLQEWNVAENQLTGNLPTQFNTCWDLQVLNVRNNAVTGTLPAWPSLVNLMELNVAHNALTGPLPDNFLQAVTSASSRRKVVLAHNQLTGAIPTAWSVRFSNLFLDVTDNDITRIFSNNNDCSGTLQWMDGLVATYGCDALLCPRGTFSTMGRQTDADHACLSCPSATAMGSTSCASDGDNDKDPNDSRKARELEILTALYQATHGEDWIRNDGWTVTANYCTWYGITCDPVHQWSVESIALPHNGLTGTPPSSLWELPALGEVDLSGNPLEFTFAGIGQAQNLVLLDLSSTNLDSVVGLDALPSALLELNLNDNRLSGVFPRQILSLHDSLRKLSLNSNQLSGFLPGDDLAQFHFLQELFLFDNQLEGPLPGALGQLGSLVYLGLSGNQWTGQIPPQWNNLRRLETLALQGNTERGSGRGLTGHVPSFQDLPNLKQVYLGFHSLIGTIPENFMGSVSDLGAPITIDLSNNRLTGSLPPALARFESLELYASDNEFTEPIATGICRQSGWMRAQVGEYGCQAILCPPNTFQTSQGRQMGFSNALQCQPCPTGQTAEFYGSTSCLSAQEQAQRDQRRALEDLYWNTNGDHWVDRGGWMDPDVSICDWHGVDCKDSSVQSIQLIHNGLEGNLPETFFAALPNLVELDLSWNENMQLSFHGPDLAEARSLQFLNLDYTGLTSVAGLQTAPTLELLRLVGNQFGSGVFPTQVLQIPNLQALYLSNNDIGTALPTSGWSTGFVGLECKGCNLQGPFPSFLGTLVNLEYLNLADNFLTGNVAVALNAMTQMKVLDLSNQANAGNPGLGGNLPSFASAPELREVYLHNNGFSSAIPSDFLASVLDGSIKVDLRFNALTGVVPGNLARFATAEFYAAGNQLTQVDPSLCGLNWNNRPQGANDCDYIMCGANEYSGLGLATPTLPCEPCNDGTATNTLIGRTFCIPGEREILLELYSALGGSQWTHQDGWEVGADDVCSWYGVKCHVGSLRQGTIEELDLSDNNLKGTLPDRIWVLTELLSLDLSDNDIVVNSFSRVGEASSLVKLNLSRNTVSSLSGIGAATSLISFRCSNCKITGPMPSEMTNLRVLEELFLNSNEMTGPLPTNMNLWTQMKELHLKDNSFNGTIPNTLASLSFVEVIDLGRNKLHGALPSDISFLANLRVLAIDHERPEFTPLFGLVESGVIGNLPSFSHNPNLRELYLSYNHIDGEIPGDFLNAVDKKATIIVDLESNNIIKEVPAALARFDDLRIYLGNNRIDGIPDEICAKKQWMDGLVGSGCDAMLCPVGTYSTLGRRTQAEECRVCDHDTMTNLYLGSTSCRAVFPEFREDRSMLEELYKLANGDGWINRANWNSGSSICNWFGVTCDSVNQDRVAEIALPSNNLDGSLGSIVFYLPRLRKVDVSGNNIKVTFRDIGDANLLESVNVKAIASAELDGLRNSPNLKELKLSDNSFYGKTFPEDFYELSGLQVLEIDNTGFSGSLVASGLAQLSNLVTFNASYNDLEGTIPDVYNNFDSLEVLDLAGNHFHGLIPTSLERARSLQFLDLSGPETSGATGLSGPMPAFANCPSLVHIDLGANSLTGTVPSDLLESVAISMNTEVTILLDSNILHGNFPSDVSDRFRSLNIDLVDNEFESLPASLCAKSEFGCQGILCPQGTFNEDGRQTSAENKCRDCPGETSNAMGQTSCPSIEKARNRKILEKLYEQTGGPNWKNQEGWFTNPDICNWYGITCRDNAFVETINLASNNLVNTPPKELFEIGGLRKLWLYSNPMNFNFEGIENAKLLENLQLDATHLKSLEGIGKAPALKHLNVGSNGLQGTLPTDEFDQLTTLEELLISENKFFGQLPHFMNNRKLTTLLASGNAFVGPLPAFDVHPMIKKIDVAHNQLFGMVPNNFLQVADTTNRMLVDISHNRLQGNLPGFLTRFPDMTLYAQGNQFTGLDRKLCEMDQWNGGSVGLFECDALLCPPQSFAPQGRASAEQGDCEPCPNAKDAPFYGHTTCGGVSSSASTNSTRPCWLWVWMVLTTMTVVWLVQGDDY